MSKITADVADLEENRYHKKCRLNPQLRCDSTIKNKNPGKKSKSQLF